MVKGTQGPPGLQRMVQGVTYVENGWIKRSTIGEADLFVINNHEPYPKHISQN